jgi:hypothetical protein
MQRVLDTPLPQLMDSDEERAAAEELARDARAVPAMVRLAALVAFVGDGRPATQAGNLKAPDGVAAAIRLGTRDEVPGAPRSMDDMPEVAHDVRWAIAAELLAARGTKIVAGPRAQDLERDPLSAWFKAAVTLLEHGLLDGFRRGWRKSYVELLDAGAGPILAAILEAGGQAPLTAIDELVWEPVARVYDYDLDDAAERQHVVRLVKAMVTQFADIGAITIRNGERSPTSACLPLPRMTDSHAVAGRPSGRERRFRCEAAVIAGPEGTAATPRKQVPQRLQEPG